MDAMRLMQKLQVVDERLRKAADTRDAIRARLVQALDAAWTAEAATPARKPRGPYKKRKRLMPNPEAPTLQQLLLGLLAVSKAALTPAQLWEQAQGLLWRSNTKNPRVLVTVTLHNFKERGLAKQVKAADGNRQASAWTFVGGSHKAAKAASAAGL